MAETRIQVTGFRVISHSYASISLSDDVPTWLSRQILILVTTTLPLAI